MDDNKKIEQESIVDRDFEDAELTIRTLVMELRFTLKSIKDDDF
jgi:hypothetical protein